MTVRTRLARLERGIPAGGRWIIHQREPGETDEEIASKRATAARSGDVLIVVDGRSRFHGIKEAAHG